MGIPPPSVIVLCAKHKTERAIIVTVLPPRFFDRVRDAFVAFNKAGHSKSTRRS
jgi:hypothetical protein